MSLRARLLAAVALVLLVALGAASVATYSIVSTSLMNRVDAMLRTSRTGFELAVSHGQTIDCARGPRFPPPSVRHVPFVGGPGRPGTFLATQFVELRTPSGEVVKRQECPAYVGTHPYRPLLPPAASIRAAVASTSGTSSFLTVAGQTAGAPPFRVSITRLASGDLLIQGIAIADTQNTLHDLLAAEFLVSAIALFCAVIAGWFLVRVGLRPLRAVSRTAALTSSGSLDLRVAVVNPGTEIGQLGRAFNGMLDQIQGAIAERDASDQQLRRFVADASHELRTPIAAISAYAELFERAADEDPDDLERVLGGIRDEAARMESLVEDLLALARLDEGIVGARRPVELVRLCAASIDEARTLAPEWPTTLMASRPLEVLGDEHQLHRVVGNLLANVRQHTRAGTSTTVTVQSLGNEAIVGVHDDGEGMSAEDARYAFERFWRGDPSRSRLHGGSGLGLSIVRSIVASHGGSVTLESREGVGTTVQVRLVLSTHAALPAIPNGSTESSQSLLM